MATGEPVLDPEGNILLNADGNTILDDGAGNACCGCGVEPPITGCQIERGYYGNIHYGIALDRKATPEWVKIANIDSLFTGFDCNDPAEFIDYGSEWPHEYPPFTEGDGRSPLFCRPARIPGCYKPAYLEDGITNDPVWRNHICGKNAWDGVLQCRLKGQIGLDYVVWGGYKLPEDIPSIYGVRGGALDVSIPGQALSVFTQGSVQLDYVPENPGHPDYPFTMSVDGIRTEVPTLGFGYWRLSVPVTAGKLFLPAGAPTTKNPYGERWLLLGTAPPNGHLGQYFKVCVDEDDTRPAGDYTARLSDPTGVTSTVATKHGYGNYGIYGYRAEYVGDITIPVSWSNTATIEELSERPEGFPFSGTPLKVWKKPVGFCGGPGGTTTIPTTTGGDPKCVALYYFRYNCTDNVVDIDVVRQTIICSGVKFPTGWLRGARSISSTRYASWGQWVVGGACGGGGSPTTCGICVFQSTATASLTIVKVNSESSVTTYTVTGMIFSPETCRFEGVGSYSTDGGTPTDFAGGAQLVLSGGTPTAWLINYNEHYVMLDFLDCNNGNVITTDGLGNPLNASLTVEGNEGGGGGGGGTYCPTDDLVAPDPPSAEEIAAYCALGL